MPNPCLQHHFIYVLPILIWPYASPIILSGHGQCYLHTASWATNVSHNASVTPNQRCLNIMWIVILPNLEPPIIWSGNPCSTLSDVKSSTAIYWICIRTFTVSNNVVYSGWWVNGKWAILNISCYYMPFARSQVLLSTFLYQNPSNINNIMYSLNDNLKLCLLKVAHCSKQVYVKQIKKSIEMWWN